MPITILQKSGTVIVLADTTDHTPTANSDLGARTDQIDLTGVVAGAYVQSDKFDFLTPRAAQWVCRAAIEWSTAPTAGGVVNFWLSSSNIVTDANGNDGNASGSDSAYVGYGAAAVDADEAVKHLFWLGSLVVTNDIDIQVGYVGTFAPAQRWGNLIVQNNTDQSFNADADEMSVSFTPVEDEFQSA